MKYVTLLPLRSLVLSLAFGAALVAASPSLAAAQSIPEVASGDPQFSELVDALVARDLVDTLASDGPFTVFAPTNDAFADLPSYIVSAIESDPELLSTILLYHVVSDDLDSDEVLSNRRLETVQGENLRVSQRSGGAFINSSELIALDIEADNGVVHVIDRVLIPQEVYRAAFMNVRDQLRELVAQLRDIQRDRAAERIPWRH